MIHNIFAQLDGDPKHFRHARFSPMVQEIIAVKIDRIAVSGNTIDQATDENDMLNLVKSPLHFRISHYVSLGSVSDQ